LFSRDLSRIKQLPPGKVSRVLKALSALSKFLGCHDDFKKLIKNFGLTWCGRSADDLIIDRLTKTEDPEEIWQWIRDVKDCRPGFSDFMDFISVTGLRLSEAVNSYNLIIKFSRENTLAEKYYNVKTGFLEHYRFKETFIRSSKKAYVSFVPLELLERIGAKEPIPRIYTIRKALAKRHVPQRFSDIRELHATFLIKWLSETEVDTIQGRVTGSVFKIHYWNVKLVTELKQKLSAASKEILAKINVEIEQNLKVDIES
jgi:hypothetical protein